MPNWCITVIVYGGRTGTILDNFRTVFNVDNESDAIDEAVRETLSSFNFPGTKIISVHARKSGV